MTTSNQESVRGLDWQFIVLVFILFGTIGATFGSYVNAYRFNEVTPTIHFIVLLEAVGTVAALLLIWTTVNEGRRDRHAIIDEAHADRALQKDEYTKERRKERLREQLKFYSPIVGQILRKSYEDENKSFVISKILDTFNSEYELYAEPRTKRHFRKYYMGEINTWNEFRDYGEEIRTIVLEEFANLREEYLSLVKASESS